MGPYPVIFHMAEKTKPARAAARQVAY